MAVEGLMGREGLLLPSGATNRPMPFCPEARFMCHSRIGRGPALKLTACLLLCGVGQGVADGHGAESLPLVKSPCLHQGMGRWVHAEHMHGEGVRAPCCHAGLRCRLHAAF